jgi:hypothetical protein
MDKASAVRGEHPDLARQKLSVAWGAYRCSNNDFMMEAVERLIDLEGEELEALKRRGYDQARQLIESRSRPGEN